MEDMEKDGWSAPGLAGRQAHVCIRQRQAVARNLDSLVVV
jgi:hypothetical protein